MNKMILLGIFLFSNFAYALDIKVKVNGMVCSMCAQGIQKKMSKYNFVKKIQVDMDNKIVHLQLQDGSDLTDENIKKIILEAGYNVAEIKRE